jgi:hypothetical protein
LIPSTAATDNAALKITAAAVATTKSRLLDSCLMSPPKKRTQPAQQDNFSPIRGMLMMRTSILSRRWGMVLIRVTEPLTPTNAKCQKDDCGHEDGDHSGCGDLSGLQEQ